MDLLICKRIQTLLDQSFAHRAAMTERWGAEVVPVHPPVLWFGDLQRWLAQPIEKRVITAGVNPGPLTFAPSPSPWWRGIDGDLNVYAQATARYMATLDQRGKDRTWFGKYAPVLDVFGSSFTGAAPGRALHTDIFSPLVTREAWSKVDTRIQAELQAEGVCLWVELLRVLRPSVVVLSVNRGQWEIVNQALRLRTGGGHFEYSSTKSGKPFSGGRVWRLSEWTGELDCDGHDHTFRVICGSKFFENPFTPVEGERLALAAASVARSM